VTRKSWGGGFFARKIIFQLIFTQNHLTNAFKPPPPQKNNNLTA